MNSSCSFNFYILNFNIMLRIISIVLLGITIYICSLFTYNREKKIFQDPVYTSVDVSDIDFAQLVYIPVHSKLYSPKSARTLYLSTVLKIRNTSFEDSIYISQVDYYDQHGKVLKKYLDSAILLRPMATIEIVTKEDEYKGKGDNFIVEWHAHKTGLKPVMESITFDASNCLIFVNESRIIKDISQAFKRQVE